MTNTSEKKFGIATRIKFPKKTSIQWPTKESRQLIQGINTLKAKSTVDLISVETYFNSTSSHST